MAVRLTRVVHRGAAAAHGGIGLADWTLSSSAGTANLPLHVQRSVGGAGRSAVMARARIALG